jgi:oligopeptide/dipeptide ABC transporter ATP-binding protein
MSILCITHNLGVIAQMVEDVIVMYLGKVVEKTDVRTLFSDARHPYTQALLSAAPVPDPKAQKHRILLSGDVPSPINPPPGCTFHPRCRERRDICRSETPAFREISHGRFVACHNR